MNIKTLLATFAATIALGAQFSAFAQGQILTGDTRYACEAVMCLAAGQRPKECEPSIRKYFSISHSKPNKTFEARRDFLKLCPASNQNQQMQTFVDALARSAGRCDAQMLNSFAYQTGERYVIGNVMPDYCQVMGAHQYAAALTLPRYVGLPERGGHWAEPADYERLLSVYNARIQKEENDKLLQQRQYSN